MQARFRLEDPRDVTATREQRSEELLVLRAQRHMSVAGRDGAQVNMPEPWSEAVEETPAQLHGRIDGPGMGQVEAEACLRQLLE
jgi:hypothetical protein